MSRNSVALNSEKHKSLKVKNTVNFERVKNEYLIPLVVQEFVVAGAEYPIVFVKNQETGAFQVVAVMGLQPGENLFCNSKHWEDDIYIPRLIRNYPFSLAYTDQNKSEFIVCLEESDQVLNQEQGEALFDDNGEQTAFLKKLVEKMVEDAENMQITAGFVELLSAKELLTENRLTVEIDNERRNIDGIYIIDGDKLNQLPIEEFDDIRKRGFLQAIYAQINSLQQVSHLIRKRKQTK